jgi:hypothetical protein
VSNTKQTQQELLRQAKDLLGATWDELAEASGIHPRALKNYRLPDDSKGHRAMGPFVRAAVQQIVDARVKRTPRRKAK